MTSALAEQRVPDLAVVCVAEPHHRVVGVLLDGLLAAGTQVLREELKGARYPLVVHPVGIEPTDASLEDSCLIQIWRRVQIHVMDS